MALQYRQPVRWWSESPEEVVGILGQFVRVKELRREFGDRLGSFNKSGIKSFTQMGYCIPCLSLSGSKVLGLKIFGYLPRDFAKKYRQRNSI